jgi:hypothetical protein
MTISTRSSGFWNSALASRVQEDILEMGTVAADAGESVVKSHGVMYDNNNTLHLDNDEGYKAVWGLI